MSNGWKTGIQNHQTSKKRHRLEREMIDSSLAYWFEHFATYEEFQTAKARCRRAANGLRRHIKRYGETSYE